MIFSKIHLDFGAGISFSDRSTGEAQLSWQVCVWSGWGRGNHSLAQSEVSAPISFGLWPVQLTCGRQFSVVIRMKLNMIAYHRAMVRLFRRPRTGN